MTKRSRLMTIASTLLALALVIALLVISGLDLTRFGRLVLSARPGPFLLLVLMAGAQVLLASEKWRLVERTLAGGAAPPRRFCFGLTALGAALGQILPIQIATALSRSLGSQVLAGSGAVRSGIGTGVEQGFDLLIVAVIGIASSWCVRTGDLSHFVALASALVAVVLLLLGPVASLAKHSMHRLTAPRPSRGMVANIVRTLLRSGIVDAPLARRLAVLSALRFVMLWAMAAATTVTVGLDVPALQLAAALPLVVLASALALTPAAIGVNEWTFVAALTAFGTPVEQATQWALANRLLVAMASFAIGGLGAILLRTSRPHPQSRRSADQGSGPSARPFAPQDSPAI